MIKEATAPAKVILLGEHAVVYGQPAIAIPVSSLRAAAQAVTADLGTGLQINVGDVRFADNKNHIIDDPLQSIVKLVTNKLNCPLPDLTITVNSDIPVASGLGSGAAISTAIARALLSVFNRTLGDDELNDLVYEVEKIHHGTPSGVDNTVIVYERPVYFAREKPLEFLSIDGSFYFLVADTGISALTRVAVADVRTLYEAEPIFYDRVFEAIGALVLEAQSALATNDSTKLGTLMNQNQKFLQQLTVSSTELDRLVDAALGAGAYGAKLSGGGRGGNMIALVSETTLPVVRNALYKAGAVRVFETVLN
jgi:mevalonate kinase